MSEIDENTFTDSSNEFSGQKNLPSTNQISPGNQSANEKSVNSERMDFPKPSTGGSTLSSQSG